MSEGQSEEQDLMEARAEVVLMSVALHHPAAAVLTALNVRVGLPEVSWGLNVLQILHSLCDETRKEEMTLLFVMRIFNSQQLQHVIISYLLTELHVTEKLDNQFCVSVLGFLQCSEVILNLTTSVWIARDLYSVKPSGANIVYTVYMLKEKIFFKYDSTLF